jgi:hypothetical protein
MSVGIETPQRPAPAEAALGIIGIALAYVLLFELNGALFSAAVVTDNVSWIFLPAAIRMLAVMLFEWAGVVGLALGGVTVSLIHMNPGPMEALIQSSVSAIAPMLAYIACRRWLGLPRELGGLNAGHLFVFSVAGGLSNSVLVQAYLFLSERPGAQLIDVIPMFIGDVVGTLIVLYLAGLVVRLVRTDVRQ